MRPRDRQIGEIGARRGDAARSCSARSARSPSSFIAGVTAPPAAAWAMRRDHLRRKAAGDKIEAMNSAASRGGIACHLVRYAEGDGR